MTRRAIATSARPNVPRDIDTRLELSAQRHPLTWRATSARPNARRGFTLSLLTSYDAASNICQVPWHPMTWQATCATPGGIL